MKSDSFCLDEANTPGSKVNPSRTALLSLIEAINETQFTVEAFGVGGLGTLQSRIQHAQVSTRNLPDFLPGRLV